MTISPEERTLADMRALGEKDRKIIADMDALATGCRRTESPTRCLAVLRRLGIRAERRLLEMDRKVWAAGEKAMERTGIRWGLASAALTGLGAVSALFGAVPVAAVLLAAGGGTVMTVAAMTLSRATARHDMHKALGPMRRLLAARKAAIAQWVTEAEEQVDALAGRAPGEGGARALPPALQAGFQVAAPPARLARVGTCRLATGDGGLAEIPVQRQAGTEGAAIYTPADDLWKNKGRKRTRNHGI